MDYSGHAQERLQERGIDDDDVQTVLRRPIGPPDAGNGSNLLYRGFVRGKTLAVVVTASGDLIVTAYWET